MSNEQRATSLKKIFLSLIAHCSLLLFLSCDSAPKKLYNEAERKIFDGKYQQAVEKYTQILERYPHSGYADDALFKLGETHFLNLNNMQVALGYFSELINKGKRNKISYSTQKYIAQIYDEYLKNYDKAIIEYYKLKSNYGVWGDTDKNQFNIAKCYFKKGDYEQAAIEFKIFLETYPKNEFSPDALYQFSNCKYLLGRYNEAIAGYKRLIENYPQSRYIIDGKYGIGMCLEEQERLGEALVVYREIGDKYINKEMLAKKIDGLEKRMRELGR